MTYRSVDIPFFTGQDESFDKKMLPVGPVARIENAIYEKSGRLIRRPGLRNRPLPQGIGDGSVVASHGDVALVWDRTKPFSVPVAWDSSSTPETVSSSKKQDVGYDFDIFGGPYLRLRSSFQILASAGDISGTARACSSIGYNDSYAVVATTHRILMSSGIVNVYAKISVFDANTSEFLISHNVKVASDAANDATTNFIENVSVRMDSTGIHSGGYSVMVLQGFAVGGGTYYVRPWVFVAPSILENPAGDVRTFFGAVAGDTGLDVGVVTSKFRSSIEPSIDKKAFDVAFSSYEATVKRRNYVYRVFYDPKSLSLLFDSGLAASTDTETPYVNAGNFGASTDFKFSPVPVTQYTAYINDPGSGDKQFHQDYDANIYVSGNGAIKDEYGNTVSWTRSHNEARKTMLPSGCTNAPLFVTGDTVRSSGIVSPYASYSPGWYADVCHAVMLPYPPLSDQSPVTLRGRGQMGIDSFSHSVATDDGVFCFIYDYGKPGQYQMADSPNGTLVASPMQFMMDGAEVRMAGFLGPPLFDWGAFTSGTNKWFAAATWRTKFNGVEIVSGTSAISAYTNSSVSSPVINTAPIGGAGLDAEVRVFQTTAANASILKDQFGEIIYTQGGVLPNDTPPPCDSLVFSSGRMWAGGLHHMPRAVQVSKVITPGFAVAWSNFESFIVQLPSRVTALGAMDNAVLAFCDDAVYIIGGDGPDDRGIGEIATPQRIPGTSRCRSKFGVLSFENGVSFVSSRGLELIARGFQAATFFGQPVMDVTSEYPTCRGGVNMLDHSEVRWLFTKPGRSAVVVYNTRMNAWSVLKYKGEFYSIGLTRDGTRMTLYGAILSQAFVEDSTLETDMVGQGFGDPEVVQYVETGWMRLGGINGSAYARKINLLGTFKGDCEVTIRFGYDDKKDWHAKSKTWTLSSTDYSDGDDVCLELMVPVQKVKSIRFLVEVVGELQGNAITVFYDSEGEGPRVSARSKG